MSESIYKILAWVGRYLLPAVTALWVAVAKIWNLPYGTEIAGTLAAITTFLNAVLGINSTAYWKEHEINEVSDGG